VAGYFLNFQTKKIMNNRKFKKEKAKLDQKNQQMISFPGYLPYPPEQDIYVQSTKESEINPENIGESKITDEIIVTGNDPLEMEPQSGSDLDIPGAELDDQNEAIGTEDEENNYYSIGGDGHNDLEEDKASG